MKNSTFQKFFLGGALIFAVSAIGAGYWFSHAPQSQGEVRPQNTPQSREKLAGLFCPQMANEQSYKDNRVQTYATLIPGKDGWIFRTKNDFRTDWSIKDETIERLSELQKAMRSHNAELVIVIPPVRGMIHADEMFDADRKKYKMDNIQSAWDMYEKYINNMRSQGVNIVGLSRNEVNDKFYYLRNHHWTSDGARAMAKKSAQTIKALPTYGQIEKVAYVSQPEKPETYKSSYARAFQKICGTNVPPEEARGYTTIPADDAKSQQALFDDQAEPRVVLLGTSNSVNESSEANFDGFLKEFLSADVMNLAVAGAGIDTSLISYLNSDHYKSSTSKIVIWEIPGYYDLDTMNDNLFSQAIPAAYGGCGEDALARGNYKNLSDNDAIYASMDGGSIFDGIPEGDSPVQPNLETNNDLYLHLSFSKPVKQEYAVKFHYKTGDQNQTKILKFKRSNRYPADGEFYVMFPEMEKNAELNKIRLSLPDKIRDVDMSMQVCTLPNAAAPQNESM